MKTTILLLLFIFSLSTFAKNTECTVFVNEIKYDKELNIPASRLARILKKRGYELVDNINDANYSIEYSYGSNCTMYDDSVSGLGLFFQELASFDGFSSVRFEDLNSKDVVNLDRGVRFFTSGNYKRSIKKLIKQIPTCNKGKK